MDKSIQQMEQDLAHAEYSPSTQGQYIKTIEALGGHYDRPVADLRRDELRAYVEHLRGQGRSASWLKMKLAAIVFLFSKTLGREADVSFIVWPRQYSPLPTVLSLHEVDAFLTAIRHPVYRAVAMVLYGTGLRISEALAGEHRKRAKRRLVLVRLLRSARVARLAPRAVLGHCCRARRKRVQAVL